MKEIKNKHKNDKQFLEDGIILLNKPKGISSFAAINKLKWLINAKKVGHAGTLDPMAEGLLIVLVNSATKFSQNLIKKSKIYEVSMDIGYSTDTYDSDGIILQSGNKLSDVLKNNNNLESNDKYILDIIKSFLGSQKQIPPMYSAIKVDGQKLYNLARKGIEVKRSERDIEIHQLYDIYYSIEKSNINFKANVSSGTYIRSLVDDIGKKMGTFATMTYLKRIQIGEYNIDDSITLDELSTYFNEQEKILSEKKDILEVTKFIHIEDLFEYDKLYLNNEFITKLRNGMTVKLNESLKNETNYNVYSIENRKFIGIVKSKTNGYVKRDKYFN